MALRPLLGELHITMFWPNYIVRDEHFKSHDIIRKNTGIYNFYIQGSGLVSNEKFDRFNRNGILFLGITEKGVGLSAQLTKLIFYSKCLIDTEILCKLEVNMAKWDKISLLNTRILQQH